jgi:hypothetical protein
MACYSPQSREVNEIEQQLVVPLVWPRRLEAGLPFQVEVAFWLLAVSAGSRGTSESRLHA